MVTIRWGSYPAATLLAGGLLAGALAGCSGSEDGRDATGGGAAQAVTIASGDLWFDPDEVTVDAGEVMFTLDNAAGAVEHDLVIAELGDLEVAYADPGRTATGTVELEAGNYTFYCSIPGHRAAMEGTLEVR